MSETEDQDFAKYDTNTVFEDLKTKEILTFDGQAFKKIDSLKNNMQFQTAKNGFLMFYDKSKVLLKDLKNSTEKVIPVQDVDASLAVSEKGEIFYTIGEIVSPNYIFKKQLKGDVINCIKEMLYFTVDISDHAGPEEEIYQYNLLSGDLRKVVNFTSYGDNVNVSPSNTFLMGLLL